MSAQRTCLLNEHVLAYPAPPLGAVAVLRDSLFHFLAVPVLQTISCKQPTACITVHNGHKWAPMAIGCTPHPHLGLLVVNSANALELFLHNVRRAQNQRLD